MPGMRGKGGRRRPWRDGGRKKTIVVDWFIQAHHAVDDLENLQVPLVTLEYQRGFTDKPDLAIYKFDQQAAKVGLKYFAEFQGHGLFKITVPKDKEEIAKSCIVKA